MNAKDLLEISKSVDQHLIEKFDEIYNDILLPKMLDVANNKGTSLEIDGNTNHRHSEISETLKRLGFNTDLQYLTRGKMKTYLIEKGFSIATSPYYTKIIWYKI